VRIGLFNVTATYISGGLETYCWESGRALAQRGHDVEIVAGNRGDAWHDEVRLVQFPFRAEKEWPDFGTRFRRLAERLSFARHSLGYLLRARYDALIVNKPFDFPILWHAKRRGLSARTLFRSGGTDFYWGDRWFAGAIDEWQSSSRFNAEEVTGRYGREVHVNHNGVDAQRFRPMTRATDWRAARGVPTDGFVLMSLGRLVGLKGLRVIIDALAQLPPRAHFVIVGDGPEAPRLKERAAQSGVAARVHFEGRVDRDRLPAMICEADLLVQPSIGAESFGISVVEAMACGLPVLASDLGGLKEIVIDGRTGRLLPQGDVAVWREAIARALKERDVLSAWGQAGHARAVGEFSWAANAERTERLLLARASR
jgi:glycosyltransferase involved in cell wall biosynthesis